MKFGPTFEAELSAAGLTGLPLVVNRDDGTVTGAEDLSPEATTKLQAVIDAHNPNKGTVPNSVTPSQARLAFLEAGLLPAVEAAVKNAGGATQITWEYATQINRDDALITTLGVALGLTDPAIDLLFKKASLII